MGSFTINDIDDHLKRRLQVQAAKHGCSVEEEARRILAAALPQREEKESRNKLAGKHSKGLGTEIHERFKALGGVELEPFPRNEILGDDSDTA